jgi:hypothetical protein
MTRPQYERSRLPPLLLMIGVVALVLLNWRLLTMEIDISPTAGGDAADPALLSAADWQPGDASAADAVTYPQMLARPLFRSDRRPPDASKPQIASRESTPAHVAKLPDDIQLVGIMKETGGAGRALIRSGDSPTGRWIEIGQILNGWRLSGIDAASVFFETNGETQKLSLFPHKDDEARTLPQ